jgi:chromosome partitioning protein
MTNRAAPWRGRVITWASGKGGAGKSTLCAAVAAELLARGERVRLVDADPQQAGGLRQWVEAGEALQAAQLLSEPSERAASVARELAADAVVLVDSAGSLTRTLAALLEVSDVVLVPCKPSGLDAARAVELVQMVGQLTQAPAAVVLNGATRSAMPDHIRAELKAAGVRVLRSQVGQRVAFATAQLYGSGPALMGSSARQAAAEVRALVNEIGRLMP